MMMTNQKKIATLAALGLLWGGIVAWEWLAVEEPVRVPLTNVSGPASTPRATPWNSRGVARAARSPRSRANSTRDDLHARHAISLHRLALMTRGLLVQTSQSSILGRSRHCASRRSLPDWHNSTISGLCGWRRGGGKRANWLCSRRMTTSMSSGQEKLLRITSW